MSWAWRDMAEPHEPQGVVGSGDVARRLLRALDRGPETERSDLMVTANEDVLVVCGRTSRLPWADGVIYIAPSADAPTLWFPTTCEPAVALDLLEQAIHRLHAVQPYLLLPASSRLVPLLRQVPATRAVLQRIRERWRMSA